MARLQAAAKRFWPWAVPLVALLMLVLMLIPAEVWHPPANDGVYQGFDPNLIYVSETGYPHPQKGTVDVSPQSLKITALPDSQPTVTLVTTPLQGFTAAMDVRLAPSREGSLPLRIGIWSARTGSGHFVEFGPSPANRITAQTVIKGAAAQTLVGGSIVKRQDLGSYAPGQSYHLELTLDKKAGLITSRVSSLNPPSDRSSQALWQPVSAEFSSTTAEAPDLFNSLRLSLTASSFAPVDALGTATLENYSLTLSHQRWQAVQIDDPRATGPVIALLALGGLLVAVKAVLWVRQKRTKKLSFDFAAHLARRLGDPASKSGRTLAVWIIALVFTVFTFNALLFGLGNLPFDMTSSKVWAYVSATSGPTELYHLPNLVSLARVWGGGPYHEAIFPYQPVFAYLFAAIGALYTLFLKGPGPPVMDTFQLEMLIKAFAVLFALADSLLIYAILRKMNISQRWSLIGGGMLLLNPAVWFSTSVWGQTHVISVFFLLASIWLAETKHPRWVALAAGALTRPQMLVPLVLLGLLLFRKFSFKENLHGICWSIILAFLALAPFLLAISPSLPVDLLANQLFIQEGGGNETALTTVSLDALSFWPSVTYVFEGVRGQARFYFPSTSPLIGEMSYQRISQILVMCAVVGVGVLLLWRRRSATKLEDYLPLMAFGTIAFLMFKTGIAATHFIIGLPLIILCRRPLDNLAYCSLVVIWSATTLVPMFGTLGLALTNVSYLAPALAPANNAVTRFFMGLYSSDRFITLGSLANMVVLGLLAAFAVQGLLAKKSKTSPAATALAPQPQDPPEHE